MITAKKIRNLPVSAASGLVINGKRFYVIADDALHLSVFSFDDNAFLQQLRLRDGELPTEKSARKKKKPDFEALVQLPPQAAFAHGALLALGSGSKSNRQQGVLIPFQPDGALSTNTLALDLAPLYAALPFADTNIEGAVICDEKLVLLQRGNQQHQQSALVILQENSVGARFIAPNHVAAPNPIIVPCSLPMIDSCPLGFTDGLCLPNGNIIFSAVAEATDDSYQDGACLGAAIGEITLRGELLRCEWLSEPHKIEGIALGAEGTSLYAVTDADDPAVPAQLLLLEGWQ